MGDGLSRDPIERYEDRQAIARCANRLTVLMHRSVCPGHENLVGVLRLGCEDQQVVNIELDLLGPADCRE
jgi:hypothetical protein